MKRRKHGAYSKVIAVILTVILLTPVYAQAAAPETIAPMASDHLDTYYCYILPTGGGNLQIRFEAWATSAQESLGVSSLIVYESTDNANWYWVKTFYYQNTPAMVSHNASTHKNHVPYTGVSGRYYKVLATFWGGSASGYDSQEYWADPVYCS